MVGAQDYALFRLCFCEGHRTLLPPKADSERPRQYYDNADELRGRGGSGCQVAAFPFSGVAAV